MALAEFMSDGVTGQGVELRGYTVAQLKVLDSLRLDDVERAERSV
jgi:hypothetical protein